jgi:hypothetical protein
MGRPSNRDAGKESFRVPAHVAEYLRRVSKTQRVPLPRLVAEALTAWCQARGIRGVTHDKPPTENPTDLRW